MPPPPPTSAPFPAAADVQSHLPYSSSSGSSARSGRSRSIWSNVPTPPLHPEYTMLSSSSSSSSSEYTAPLHLVAYGSLSLLFRRIQTDVPPLPVLDPSPPTPPPAADPAAAAVLIFCL